MTSNPLDPSDLRDTGLELLRKGKEYFKNENHETQVKGYELYKKGLEFIIRYLKSETNPNITAKVKENLKTWMNEAKSMETTLFEKPYNPKIPNSQNQSGLKRDKNFQPTSPLSPYNKRDRSSPKDSNSPRKKLKEQDKDVLKLASDLESVIITEKPNVKWDDIAGLEQAKRALQEAVIYPIKFPSLFEGMRTPWKGILLYGPPGTGKTFLAKACATEAEATFFTVSAADVTSKYLGESEKLIKMLFKMAREKKPAIIFIDEIDSLLSKRSDNENDSARRIKTEFLIQMQGVGHDDTGILVLGATNIPWALDPAVRRRFEKRIYIPLPDYPARLALLKKQMSITPNSLSEDDLFYLAERTNGYSGADMNILIRDASFQPLRRAQNATHFRIVGQNASGKPLYEPCAPSDPRGQRLNMLDIPGDQLTLPSIAIDDFEISLLKTKPSVNKTDLIKQEEFTKDFGIEG